MINDGFRNVFALKGGWREWFRAKYPVEKNEPCPCVVNGLPGISSPGTVDQF
jgi:3-mercaptopyruvate sulfurtransferase SseA